MSDRQIVTRACALCEKTIDVFSCSWDMYFAAGRTRSAISGYGCGSCGSMICSDCREKTVKWSVMDGFEKARCPKCKEAFQPIRIYAEREFDAEELSQAVKRLKMSLSFLGASPDKAPSQLGEQFLELGEPGLESLLSALDSAKGITAAGYAEAARALAERGEPRAAAKLAAMLAGDAKSRVVLDAHRSASIEPLARLDPESARRLLEGIVADEREPVDLRAQAAEKLGSLGRTESTASLVQALANPTWNRAKLVAAAAGALGRTGDPRSVEALLAALKISDPDAKAAVVGALGALKDPRAIEAIRPHLRSGHPRLRQAAAVALNGLGWHASEDKERAVLAESLPVEKERFCFSCDRPVGDATTCPHCQTALSTVPRSPAMAGFLGFLLGNLMGFIVLVVLTLVGALLKAEVDVKIRALLYGITAVSVWQATKARLVTAADLAVLKPKAGSAPTPGSDTSA